MAGVAALGLYGCKPDSQPSNALPPVAEGAALVEAPAADALPPAAPVPVTQIDDPREDYAFADRAYEMSDMYGDTPPDYVYDYEGSEPWVWVSDDGSERVAEAVPGGERYYYYESGADEPFFVQDPSYGYGFVSGRLVAVYDRSGRVLPSGDARGQAQIAGRYLVRARSLYDAARQDRHLPVARSNWVARRAAITGQRQSWQQEINQDSRWREYHAQNAPAVEAHWQGERAQRLKWAAHVDETMHIQDQAPRERGQAQTVTAAPAPPPARLAAPAQHAAPLPSQPQAVPQPPPRQDFAREQYPHHGDRGAPGQQPAPQQRAAETPPQMAMAPRHEHGRQQQAPSPPPSPPQQPHAAPQQAPHGPPQQAAAAQHPGPASAPARDDKHKHKS